VNVLHKSYRYYYSILNDSQKKTYELIYKGVCSYRDSIKIQLLHPNELELVHEAILLDNPEIFYFEAYQYLKDLNKKTIIIKPDYKYSHNDISYHQKNIANFMTFINSIKDKSEYEKIIYVHDYILDNITYDFHNDAYSVLGIINHNTGVCEGIAKFVKFTLDHLLLKSIVTTGHAVNPAFEQEKSENHAWNMVVLNGNWYHFDVTFDLTLKHKKNRYDYFLVRDCELKRSHSMGNRQPESTSMINDYYYINDLVVENIIGLGRVIYENINKGNQIFQIKLVNVPDGFDPTEKVMQEAEVQCQRFFNSYSINVRYNNALWIYEIEIKS